MASRAIVKAVQDYLREVSRHGIPVRFGVLYGSHVQGKVHEWSDIDVLVVSPRYDQQCTHEDWTDLWLLAAHADRRIEPIPVGEKQFEQADSLIIQIARREGQIIPFAE